MNSAFPNRWSFSYLKFTKYVTNIIAEPKYKYGQQEQVTVRNHNRSTAFASVVVPYCYLFLLSVFILWFSYYVSDIFFKFYNLDPAYYFSCPGFAWDAMLKMTDINLKLITDIDMYQMVETGLRGGVSYIANRYSKPNNKYLSDYDENKDSSYSMYLDANNLYGWAMSQSLPTGRFKWLKEDKWDDIFKKKKE